MKVNGVLFLFCIWILFCACPDPNRETFLENKYPSDVNVPGVGTLEYTRTLWDQNTQNNRRGDTGINDAKKIDGEIWTFASTSYGDTLIKGLNRSASVTIQYPDRGGIFRYAVSSMNIISKGNYIIFIVQNDTTYYEDGAINIYYIARVHRTTMNRQYIRMPGVIDGKNLSSVYHGNGEVFLKFENFDVSKDELIVSYYMLNNDCDNVMEITVDNFNDLYSPDPDFVTDDKGRYYRLNNGLEVSVDNGTTWYHNDMGTNAYRSIIIQNESVYVFSGQIYEMFNGGFHSEYVGGGIHEFRWK